MDHGNYPAFLLPGWQSVWGEPSVRSHLTLRPQAEETGLQRKKKHTHRDICMLFTHTCIRVLTEKHWPITCTPPPEVLELINKVASVCAYRDGNVISLCEECSWICARPSVIALRCLLELRILQDGRTVCTGVKYLENSTVIYVLLVALKCNSELCIEWRDLKNTRRLNFRVHDILCMSVFPLNINDAVEMEILRFCILLTSDRKRFQFV